MATLWPIVFMGTPEIAAATLAQLIQGPDPVVGVVTPVSYTHLTLPTIYSV